jgi:hypothetical protein
MRLRPPSGHFESPERAHQERQVGMIGEGGRPAPAPGASSHAVCTEGLHGVPLCLEHLESACTSLSIPIDGRRGDAGPALFEVELAPIGDACGGSARSGEQPAGSLAHGDARELRAERARSGLKKRTMHARRGAPQRAAHPSDDCLRRMTVRPPIQQVEKPASKLRFSR